MKTSGCPRKRRALRRLGRRAPSAAPQPTSLVVRGAFGTSVGRPREHVRRPTHLRAPRLARGRGLLPVLPGVLALSARVLVVRRLVHLRQARRGMERRQLHRTEPRPRSDGHARLRGLRVSLLAPLARARQTAEGRQDAGRELAQLLAPLRRRDLRQREQGREAGRARVPARREARPLVRGHR